MRRYRQRPRLLLVAWHPPRANGLTHSVNVFDRLWWLHWQRLDTHHQLLLKPSIVWERPLRRPGLIRKGIRIDHADLAPLPCHQLVVLVV